MRWPHYSVEVNVFYEKVPVPAFEIFAIKAEPKDGRGASVFNRDMEAPDHPHDFDSTGTISRAIFSVCRITVIADLTPARAAVRCLCRSSMPAKA